MKLSVYSPTRKHISLLPPIATLTLLLSMLPLFGTPVQVHHIGAQARPMLIHSFKGYTLLVAQEGQKPPTYAQCQKAGFLCYSPQEERSAYSLTSLIKKGYTGKRQTIAIIDSFGSPTAWQDLKTFDKGYGLPDPPSFKQLAPIGSVPFDPNNSDQVGWAEETSLDVQWAHAMAPDAKIVVLTSPVSETQGVQGMPEFLKLEQYGIQHHYKIFTQSWSTTENTLFTPEGKKILDGFNNFYKDAVLNHQATFFASTGDSGSANVDVHGNTYQFPTVGFPASSPWVTAVGGTSLYADINGKYRSETTWNDGIGSATGGGVSQYFLTPAYQHSLPASDRAILKGHRGIPDISSNADPNTGVPVYLGFLGQGNTGYYVFGGTSESSPTWAGILADASQYAGHSITNLNDRLYEFGLTSSVRKQVYHDVTVGDNSQPPVAGYNAITGWDPATGLGTPVGSKLLPALALPDNK